MYEFCSKLVCLYKQVKANDCNQKHNLLIYHHTLLINSLKVNSQNVNRQNGFRPKDVEPIFLFRTPSPLLKLGPGNTKGGSISVPLTSCLTGLESVV